MLHTRSSFLASPLLYTIILSAALVTAHGQTTTPADSNPAKSEDTKPADTKAPDTKTDTRPDAKPADTTPTNTKLALKAALVLTPEFCETKVKPKGSWATKEPATFEVGKFACAELEPALQGTFASLTRVAAPPSPEEAQLILLPRIVDVSATTAMTAFSNREMVVLLEWTVKDASGKTVWIETVQGTAKHHIGNIFTHGKNVKLIVEDSVKSAAQQSASKIASAPELRKLAQ